MKPEYKFGLIFGITGLAVNLLIAPAMAVCTPFVSFLAGGLAGYYSARKADLPLQKMGGQVGAAAGGIAGGIIFLGQALGFFLGVAIFQGGFNEIFSFIPSSTDPIWLSSLTLSSTPGAALFFGIGGAIFAGIAGAGMGFTATQSG